MYFFPSQIFCVAFWSMKEANCSATQDHTSLGQMVKQVFLSFYGKPQFHLINSLFNIQQPIYREKKWGGLNDVLEELSTYFYQYIMLIYEREPIFFLNKRLNLYCWDMFFYSSDSLGD